MTYPACYPYWLEAELAPGLWDTDLPVRASARTLEEALGLLQDLRNLGEPWAGRRARLVTPEGRVLEELGADRIPQVGGASL